MAAQPHMTPTSDNQEALDLLHRLIDTPPASNSSRFRPIALRSAKEQRRYALRGYLVRTWVDVALRYAERLLMLALVLFFGFWVLDGPVRDWTHEYQVTPHERDRTSQPRLSSDRTASVTAAAPLPYTTRSMEQTSAQSDLLIPRQRLLSGQIRTSLAPTRLLIPAIELDTPVKEVFVVDGAWEVADYAAGYLHGTGLPGEPGNMALAGHAGLRGAVFGGLAALKNGDDVFVEADGWQYHYRVRESKHVWPTQVEVLAPMDTPTLTLITCTNWDTQRLVIVADLVGSRPSPGF